MSDTRHGHSCGSACDASKFNTFLLSLCKPMRGRPLQEMDDFDLIGRYGFGNRRGRKLTLARWGGTRASTVLNPMRGGYAAAEKWTCVTRLRPGKSACDFCVPRGFRSQMGAWLATP